MGAREMKSIYVKGYAPAIEYVPFLDYNLSLSYYQEHCRIYMDEYPEGTEVSLRVNFDTSLLMKRFMVKE
jgi:hypothetical protein